MAITDLSMPLREGMSAYPAHGRSVVEIGHVQRHSDFAGRGRRSSIDGMDVSFDITQWLIIDQAGTHMDAPWHADSSSAMTIDLVPLEIVYGSAVRIDVAGRGHDEVTRSDLQDQLAKMGESLRPDDIVLVRTGASDTVATDPSGYAISACGFDITAATWLREVGVKLVGIDCATIESAPTAHSADIHTIFLRPSALGLPQEAVIAVVENLVGLDRIPEDRFVFAAFPLPLVGAAGSPVRAVAITETQPVTG